MVGLSDFRSHSKTRPFATQPFLDHLKSRLVWISDPHCDYLYHDLHFHTFKEKEECNVIMSQSELTTHLTKNKLRWQGRVGRVRCPFQVRRSPAAKTVKKFKCVPAHSSYRSQSGCVIVKIYVGKHVSQTEVGEVVQRIKSVKILFLEKSKNTLGIRNPNICDIQIVKPVLRRSIHQRAVRILYIKTDFR